MNIVYIVEDFSENGGVERIISMKANTLCKQYHHHVTLISIYQDERPQLYTLEDEVSLKLLHVPFAHKKGNKVAKLYSRIYTLWLASRRLNKELKDINPDVIFFTTTLGALLLPLCHHHAKKIYESHQARPFNPYHSLFYGMEKKADTIVCLTEGDAKEFKHTQHVCVIPNFIDIPSNTVKDYSTPKAIAVGRLEKTKGFDRLIYCWNEIKTQFPDWQLDIYGEGSEHEALQALISHLHLDKQVILRGRKDNMSEIYPQYSLHIMSSHHEGLPMVMIEAQSFGLPSVTFDFKFGASDIIQNEKNGFLISQDDTKSFISSLKRMMSSTSLRQKYGMTARNMAKKYDKEKIMKQWLKFLKG